jgi:hypothetical protein
VADDHITASGGSTLFAHKIASATGYADSQSGYTAIAGQRSAPGFGAYLQTLWMPNDMLETNVGNSVRDLHTPGLPH